MPRVDTEVSTTGRRVVDETYSTPTELSRLRALAKATLEDDGCTSGHINAVVLVLTELATNALTHADPPFRAVVELDDDETLVQVVDHSERLAVARSPAFVDGGYGLQLINTIATTWGANPGKHDKTVWAAISRRQML